MEEMQYMAREEYRYFAFVSYSHKDMAWAKWVQNKLEHYRLPAQIRKKHVALPQKLAPVFRDETDLAGPVLEEALQRELERSQYLIVICSPNSVASSYVNDEIEYFLSLGRKKQIIPLVVEGQPFSGNSETECFPPAIRGIVPELLGISVQEHGKKDAFSRLVATLLRLPADEVVMREKKRDAFHKGVAAIATAVLAVVLGLTLWYNTEHSAYYNAYIYRYEIPEGIYPLSDSQREQVSECYKITTLRGKVVRLETVNSLGVAIKSQVSHATAEYPVNKYEYDDTGMLIAVIQCDEAGQEMSRKSLSYPADGRIVVEFSNSASGEALGLSADLSNPLTGSDASQKSMINRQDNSYDENGLMIQSVYYWYSTFHPACDNNGVYGKTYIYNNDGQIVSISNLDRDGSPINCRYGWGTVVMEYDTMGNLVSDAYYSVDGTKAMSEKGHHGRVLTYDDHGNLTELVYIDKAGKPCNTDDGISRQVAEYDDHGFLISKKVYNAQGAPVVQKGDIHEYGYEYDSNGRATRFWLLGRDGQPVEDSVLGYVSVYLVFDDEGNQIEQWMYDVQGQVLRVRLLTYEAGKTKSIKYVDGEGASINYNGFCECQMEYDQYGNRCAETYYDRKGKLILTEAGYASRRLEYDEFGNIVRVMYYGTDGRLCPASEGYAVVELTYVDGRQTSSKYYDAQNHPTLTSGGYHERRMAYNEVGACIRIENYGTDGKLILCAEGYAMAEQVCDAAGNVTEIRYYGTKNEPILLHGEYHIMKAQFDAANNLTHSWYFDTNGNLTMRSEGYAAVERDYNEYGDTVAWRYFGTDNQPVLFQGQYYETRYSRDANRQITELWYYGTEGELVVIGDGYAGMRAEYNTRGDLVGAFYYGTDGEPMMMDDAYHGIRWETDGNGNTTHQWYYGTDTKLRMQRSGYAAFEQDYDSLGNLIAIRYYGEQNEPILRYGEYHELQWEFDSYGNVVQEMYYGTDGGLILNADGYAAMEIDYDELGNVIAMRYFGTQQEPILCDGIHEVRWEYDEAGNKTRIAAFDTKGELLFEQRYDVE